MMALSDEEYRMLDELYSKKRQFFEEWKARYPLLEDVINGKDSFTEHAKDIKRRSLKHVRKFVTDSRNGERLLQELKGFYVLITDLYFGPVPHMPRPFSENQIEDVLMHRLPLWWPEFHETLDRLCLDATNLDSELRRLYAPTLFYKAPELFRETYAKMKPDVQAYIERTLHRMLGAGMLKMDEIELERIIREARAQAGGDDDGAE